MRFFRFAPLTLVFLAACGSQPLTTTDDLKAIPATIKNGQLENRIQLEHSRLGIASIGGLKAQSFSDDYTLVGVLPPPSVQVDSKVVPVRATQVSIIGHFALVGYNREGPAFVGGVEVIDIADPEKPVVVSQSLFSSTDVNAVHADVNSGDLYFAGATDLAVLAANRVNLPARAKPAVLGRLKINADGSLQTGAQVKLLGHGYAGNGVATGNGTVLVSSGDGRPNGEWTTTDVGGLGKLDPVTLELQAWQGFTNSQYVDFELAPSNANSSLDTFGLEAGKTAKLHLFNSASGGFVSQATIDLGPVGPVDGKNTLDAAGRWLFVAKGEAGVVGYDLAQLRADNLLGNTSSVPAFALANQVPAGVENPEEYLSNAVAVDGNNVYIAGGAAGVVVTRIPSGYPASGSVSTQDLQVQGVFDLRDWHGQRGSANFVTADPSRRLLFVASGEGGLKIIRRNLPNTKRFASSLASGSSITVNGSQTFLAGAGLFPLTPSIDKPVVADMVARAIPTACGNVVNENQNPTDEAAFMALFGNHACLEVHGDLNPKVKLHLNGKTLIVTGDVNASAGLALFHSTVLARNINIDACLWMGDSRMYATGNTLNVNVPALFDGVSTLASSGKLALNGASSGVNVTWPNTLLAAGTGLTFNGALKGKMVLWSGGGLDANGEFDLTGTGMARGAITINGNLKLTLETRSDNPDLP